MVERRPPAPVPRVPAVERGIGHRDVDRVGAIVGPHDLADVGGGSERARHWSGIEEVDLPAAAMQLERRRDAEDPAADNDNRAWPIGMDLWDSHWWLLL